MKTHRVASADGCSAHLDVLGHESVVKARIRVVRSIDGERVFTQPFSNHERRFVVQWAHELGASLLERFSSLHNR